MGVSSTLAMTLTVSGWYSKGGSATRLSAMVLNSISLSCTYD